PAQMDDPRYSPPEPTGYVFDPKTRQWKPGTYDLGAERVERLGPNRFRLFWRGRPRHAAAVGDLMAFRGRGNTDIRVGDCAAMTLADITILSGGGFCIHEDGGDGGSRFSYKVTYGPKPPGATAAPLIACNADAFHSSGVRKGPTLENCLFEGMCDDGIPIHGSYSLVARSSGDRLVVTDGRFRPGDPLRLLTPEGEVAAEAAVRSIAPLKDFQPPAAKSRHRTFADLTRRRFSELTLDRPLAAGFDWLVSNPAAIGSGYVVRNNIIRNHRARGMLLKADNGLVEGNTVDGSTIAGIVIAPELWWSEACYSRNVIVRNNTIRRVGYATTGPWSEQAGAVTVCGAGGKTESSSGHRHIVIEGNTIEDCSGPNLIIAAAKDVLVKNNRFVRPMGDPSRRGADRGIDPGALVWLSACDDVRLEGNTVSQPGPGLEKLIVTTPSARNVTGLDGGIKK
ncbi:MAG: right-handed parallel beta-helix repeat-containing protein, partial [Planctomycetes bacterium]|nr:right-handed parallel beta-helix repeat-containing protein [Planctomycetota bacterium]